MNSGRLIAAFLITVSLSGALVYNYFKTGIITEFNSVKFYVIMIVFLCCSVNQRSKRYNLRCICFHVFVLFHE
jgi:hypothetical protein